MVLLYDCFGLACLHFIIKLDVDSHHFWGDGQSYFQIGDCAFVGRRGTVWVRSNFEFRGVV